MAKTNATEKTTKSNDEGMFFGILPSGISVTNSKEIHKTNMSALIQTFGMALKFFGNVVHEYYSWMRSLTKEERADLRAFSVSAEERYRKWEKEDNAEAKAAFAKFFANTSKGFTGLCSNIVTILKNWDSVKEYADMAISVKKAIDYADGEFELSELRAQKATAEEKVRLNLELRKIELEGELQRRQLEAEYTLKLAEYGGKDEESKSE